MNAIEFIKTPFYISQMNEVIPLATINLTAINLRLGQLVIVTLRYIAIFIDTFVFIANQAVNSLFGKFEGKSIDIILLAYALSFAFLMDLFKKEKMTKAKQIEHLEENIERLEGIVGRLEENTNHKLQEMNRKITIIERKVNRLERESKMYQ